MTYSKHYTFAQAVATAVGVTEKMCGLYPADAQLHQALGFQAIQRCLDRLHADALAVAVRDLEFAASVATVTEQVAP